ncbi:MAG: hypothetical protein P8M78_07535 [Myxococcota bacterium]|nr:hypothetical protein [Myxococcota bacterium]
MNDGMIRLAVDFENPCPEWWASGGQELWDALVEAFDGNHVVVEESLADSWIREASKLPGWEGGPEWAPHPICLKAINDDEEL